jgi:hypothetical protein
MKDQEISAATFDLAKQKGWVVTMEHVILKTPKHYVDARGNKTDEQYFDYTEASSIEVPTQTSIQRWLREKHGINIIIKPAFSCYNIDKISVYIKSADENEIIDLKGLDFKDFPTYEKALEKALQKALKLI